MASGDWSPAPLPGHCSHSEKHPKHPHILKVDVDDDDDDDDVDDDYYTDNFQGEYSSRAKEKYKGKDKEALEKRLDWMANQVYWLYKNNWQNNDMGK